MSRDYKPSPAKPKAPSKGSPFLTGLLVGFLLGVAASLALVVFIKGGDNPFTVLSGSNKKPVAEQIEESVNAQSATSAEASAVKPEELPANQQGDDKTRFDFYNMLPDSESKVSTDEVKIKETPSQPAAEYAYYLQVGAFQTAEEADNMKATLALQGFESLVQTATIPDKGIWHRVRVGPLKSLDQINKTKADLIKNGFKADLIKVNQENQ